MLPFSSSLHLISVDYYGDPVPLFGSPTQLFVMAHGAHQMFSNFVRTLCTAGFIISCVSIAKAHERDQIPNLVSTVIDGVVSISTISPAKKQKGDKTKTDAPANLPKDHPLQDFFKDFPESSKKSDGTRKSSTSMGSGFVISSDGYVVTTNHTITGATKIFVTLGKSQTKTPAVLVGTDARTDLALLKVETDQKLTALSFGDSSKLQIGEQILAIGNPFGLGNTVTQGIVSGLARYIGSGPHNFIQTDAAINKGNTGGPLLTLDGKVVAVTTSIYSPSGGNVGIGFALPSNVAEPVIAALKSEGSVRRGWLGVKIQNVTDDIASSLGLEEVSGALVTSVTPGGPAEKSGIKTGDAIVEVNGQDVANSRDLARKIAELAPNETTSLIIIRNAKRQKINVALGAFPTGEALSRRQKKTSKASGSRGTESGGSASLLGMTVKTLTDAVRSKYKIKKTITSGVVVTAVDANSEAATKGIKQGDVIQEANSTKVSNVAKLRSKVSEVKKSGRAAVLLLVQSSSGDTRFLALKFGNTIDSAEDLKNLEKLD